ncbi:MAG: copper chaperone PCu(A)C [Gammaproteobacteria bacterium]|nr:copper chaperone PCu(A)C [Gammaproteobacteria bacterium]
MRFLFIIVFCFYSSLIFADSGLQLIDPWVRQSPPNAKNLAGYGELKNTSALKIKIAAIESAFFEKIEMHVTTFENGMMKMSEVKNLALSPKESVYFEPGGRHFMLIKPKSIIKPGIIVPIQIRLSSGEVKRFDMQVRR